VPDTPDTDARNADLPKQLQRDLTQTQQLLEHYEVRQYLLDNQQAWLMPVQRRLLQKLTTVKVGEVATVEITHYVPIAAPDQLLLWQLTDKANGLVALAEVVGEVIERASPLLTQRVWVIHYRYTVLLSAPLAQFTPTELQHLATLAGQKQPVRLDISVWNALYSHLFGDADSEHITTDAVQEAASDYAPAAQPLAIETIANALAARQLRISTDGLRRYHLALQVRGFVVLSGMSGVGKTWLAESYADITGAQWLTVPVVPNWMSSEDLLGFFSPISNTFQATRFTAFIQAAASAYQQLQEKAPAFHVILDEMNLARVEHYFAPFLSALEQRHRYGQAVLHLAAQEKLVLTPNLYFIGTVNLDETTHVFADKVLDRAQVVELGITQAQLAEHLGEVPHAAVLLEIWASVASVAPFGYRVVDEIGAYITAAMTLEVSWETALDEQVVQKILPKLHGMHMETLLGQLLVIAERYGLPLTAAQVRKLQTEMLGFTRLD